MPDPGLVVAIDIWADGRASVQARRRDSGQWLGLHRRTGTPLHPMSPLVKLLWFREEAPDVWRRAAHWTRFLEFDPAEPGWFDRDRFVLSNGHASVLQYAVLHLTGYPLGIRDLKQQRQWGSLTPGHPEYGHTPGVEVTTGPLGQGVGNGVGFANAERLLAARYNRPGQELVDHRTWVFCGDGDMMEGVASEASSLAGHLRLGKLTLVYEDNHITIDGPTHQPIEHLNSLRLLPNLHVIRPADGPETAEAWRAAVRRSDGPTALALSRQELPVIDRDRHAPAEGLHCGAYVLAEASGGQPELILLATGSEVWLALAARDELEQRQEVPTRVVSMPCWELFEAQPQDYRDQVLLPLVTARLAVEAGSTGRWHKWVGTSVGWLASTSSGHQPPEGRPSSSSGSPRTTSSSGPWPCCTGSTWRRPGCCGTCRPDRRRRLAMATGNPLAQFGDQGVSVWVDSIARAWLEKGELRRLRDDFSVTGVTSNPTIFQAAIGAGGFYDDQLASLASFYVSRVDTLIDPILGERVEEGGPDAELAGSRLGTAAVDNAKLAYQGWQELFAGPRWEALETRGARPQRCLWASTSTKNPNYRDVIYCEELIGRDTVNTMPLSTVEEVGEQLETEGVEKFAVSYQKLLDTIETKRAGAGG